MRSTIAFAAAAMTVGTAALGSAPAYAQEGATRFPSTSAWAMDYADDRCRLARSFGEGDKQLTLALERFQPGEFARMILIGNVLSPYRRATALEYAWGPGGAQRSGQMLRAETAEKLDFFDIGYTSFTPPIDFTAAPPPPAEGSGPPAFPKYDPSKELTAAAAVTELQLTGGLTDPVTLATGKMQKPLEALQQCTNDLVASWGMDPAALQAASRPVTPGPDYTGWLRSGLVPFQEFSKIGSVDNYIRMDVDTAGKPTGCHYAPAAPAAEYLAKACEDLMTKATFQPALAADGTAIKSYWVTSIFGLMPPLGGRR